MSKPVFVLTSEGYINLALVTHIGMPSKGKINFEFIGSVSGGEPAIWPSSVELPENEGRELIDKLELLGIVAG